MNAAISFKGGNIPVAYVYPKGLRETRDLLRRRMYFVHQRAALITHVQIVNAQYNLPEFSKKLIYAKNRAELRIADKSCKKAASPLSRRSSGRGVANPSTFVARQGIPSS